MTRNELDANCHNKLAVGSGGVGNGLRSRNASNDHLRRFDRKRPVDERDMAVRGTVKPGSNLGGTTQ